MTLIHQMGSEDQKQQWLPALPPVKRSVLWAHRAGRWFRCRITDHDRASGGRLLRAQRQKRWIGNASFADVAVICARMDDGKVSVFWLRETATGTAPKCSCERSPKSSVAGGDHVERLPYSLKIAFRRRAVSVQSWPASRILAMG
jgi:hypothetical protein